MKLKINSIKTSLLVILCLIINLAVFGQNNRIEYNGKPLFLSGANVPWVHYARDIGNPEFPVDTMAFRKMFRLVHDNGGNSMRFWLHINGVYTPEFTGNLVTGPGLRAISELKSICDIAYQNDVGLVLCLWSFDMQRIKDGALPADVLARNKYILTTNDGLDSYINNALIPMVDSLKEHPGIIAWEIFNEPEGMTEIGNWDITQHVKQSDVQKFVNRCAGAIHRTDSKAKVTNGAWSFAAASDVDGGKNYYSNDRLKAAGGDNDGTLDFYTVHYYDWDDTSPFMQPCSHWALDKPLVIAEFLPNCKYCGPADKNYETLYNNGYAGAWAWSFYEDAYKNNIIDEMQKTFDLFGDAISVNNNKLPYLPSLIVTSPVNAAIYAASDTVQIVVYSEKFQGSITKVEFFEGENKIGEVFEEPYAFKWYSIPDGYYEIKVKSTDNEWNSKTSYIINIIVGEPPIYKLEAEDAILTGASSIFNNEMASMGKYVSMKDNNGGSAITWNIVNCPKDSTYSVFFGYRLPYDYKEQDLYLNNVLFMKNLGFQSANTTDWFELELKVPLKAGANTVKLLSGWGYMDIDYLRLPFSKPQVVHVSSVEIQSPNNTDTIDIKDGKLQLIAKIYPENATNQGVTWTSDNTSVALVSQKGLVRAKANGTATITISSIEYPEITDKFTLIVKVVPTGLDEDNQGLETKIYPNPVEDKLYITNSFHFQEIYIYSSTGKLILYKLLNADETGTDISNTPQGVYIVKLLNSKGMCKNLKMIKN